MEIREKEEEMHDEQRKFSSQIINFMLIGLTIIVGVITCLSFIDGYKVKQQQKIATYIEATDRIIQGSGLYENKIMDGYSNNNLPVFSNEDAELLKALVREASSLQAPKHWGEHKLAVETLLAERYEMFTQYNSGAVSWNEEALLVMQEKSDQLEKVEKEALIDGLERYEIPFEESENGNIRFSVKTY
ncbi:hypothetical protein FIU87_04130 [Bacillus sp. THAF10]|uniref:hypothetical protein n=1 Tax=Bacillus sp. THAF10 TaxID=2587848 RepID=UPI001267D0E6|nr:hypothetical protein [Bacillus sp. THAF10]QFT87834.1 hypothetical protein FIU87_04130 [Bacillus sp. THAF10]